MTDIAEYVKENNPRVETRYGAFKDLVLDPMQAALEKIEKDVLEGGTPSVEQQLQNFVLETSFIRDYPRVYLQFGSSKKSVASIPKGVIVSSADLRHQYKVLEAGSLSYNEGLYSVLLLAESRIAGNTGHVIAETLIVPSQHISGVEFVTNPAPSFTLKEMLSTNVGDYLSLYQSQFGLDENPVAGKTELSNVIKEQFSLNITPKVINYDGKLWLHVFDKVLELASSSEDFYVGPVEVGYNCSVTTEELFITKNTPYFLEGIEYPHRFSVNILLSSIHDFLTSNEYNLITTTGFYEEVEVDVKLRAGYSGSSEDVNILVNTILTAWSWLGFMDYENQLNSDVFIKEVRLQGIPIETVSPLGVLKSSKINRV